ncbi:STAS domain-containing protein [Micromonospora okii]|uniref:STAS domain-containing protein n=1 Tax=Micromonospora okii TaxID=1182970 RepID=UPI001E4F98FA|nr:STAS domain-containing protein [Micromonospora okii]
MQQRDDRFHVRTSVSDDVVEMRATGEVDIATVGVLRSALWAAPPRPLLRLDISEVRLLSAAGVRALVAAHRRVRARGGVLVLVDPAPMVARVLRVTGLDRIIPVREGAALAVAPARPAPGPAEAVTLAPERVAASGPLAAALGSLTPLSESSPARLPQPCDEPTLACV